MIKNWKIIIEFIGMAAIVASLIFVGIEVRQSQTIAVAETNTTAMGSWAERFDAINEHADVWYRGASGDELHDAESVVFANLVNTYGTGAFMDWFRLIQLGQGETAELLRLDFVGFLHQNPGARAEWRKQQENLANYRQKLGAKIEFDTNWRGKIEGDLSMLDSTAGVLK
jgi:hypothetical protein